MAIKISFTFAFQELAMKNISHALYHFYSYPLIEALPLALLLIIGALSVAMAEGIAVKPQSITIEHYDNNKDGLVSISEALFMGMSSKLFEQADVNHDGILNHGEFATLESANDTAQVIKSTDDKLLTAKVKAELLKNTVLKGVDVHVVTYQGIVQLSGFINNNNKQLALAQSATAGELAATVQGVTKVVNNLLIVKS